MDVRFNKDMGAVQMAKEVVDGTSLGVQKQWGHDFDRWCFLLTQRVKGDFYLDLNYGNLKSYSDRTRTETYAGDLYYSKDKWAAGVEVVHNTNSDTQVRSTTSMVWIQYLIHRKVGLWAGYNRELQQESKPTTVMVGTSVRFF